MLRAEDCATRISMPGLLEGDGAQRACHFAGIIQIKFNGTSQINLWLALAQIDLQSIQMQVPNIKPNARMLLRHSTLISEWNTS
jgi:hypothetical protein